MQAAGWNMSDAWATGLVRRIVSPMSMLSGLFAYDRLLPSSLMSGLRIELQIVSALDSLVGTNDTDTLNFEIMGIRVETEAYLLTDLVLRSLNNMAATGGLEVVIDTCACTLGSRTSNTINMECRKAVSRSLQVV